MSHAGINTDDPLIGTTLAGRYRIEARVGSGAMGAVYRARQVGLERPVALKVLKRDLAWGGDTVARFRREAQAMSALHHPNTVRVFDFGSTDAGLLYLAMELLEGESTTDRLMQAGALPVTEAISIAQEVLRSIGEAHAKGIVHRDLKPDNIFLARVEGRAAPMAKVLDFGIAKAIEGERKIDQFETLDGTVFGTPRYMSPEQASGRSLDPRSDLYAVGILLYELLAGRPPFVDADAVVVMAKHIREAPAPLSKLVPDRVIPRSLEAAVARALAKVPEKRFQSAEEFDRALDVCRLDAESAARMPWVSLISARRAPLMAAAGLMLVTAAAIATWPSEDPGEDLQSASSVAAVTVPTAAQPLAQHTATEPKRRVVTLGSDPGDAEVWRDDIQLGVTPLDVVVDSARPATFQLRKPGYADHTIELSGAEGRRHISLTPLPKREASRPERERSRRTRANPRPQPKDPPATTGATTSGSPYEKF
jgi:serine/threonine protein kinase